MPPYVYRGEYICNNKKLHTANIFRKSILRDWANGFL
jgi:hypothetical protein